MKTVPDSQLSEIIEKILKPLQNDSHSFEYKNHYKAIECFFNRLRHLETSYAQIYEQLLALEKSVISNKNLSY